MKTNMLNRALTFVLAGGEGKRLQPLTTTTAKPLLSFGAEFRILDFTLSNCSNSGLSPVYLLTQFDAESVQQYVASHCWKGDFLCLPSSEANPYKGTADAVCQNRRLIDAISPEFVLLLCADHVYKMDYRNLLSFHVRSAGDVTIAAVEHPVSLANRFGVIEVGAQDQIIRFDEKPERPRAMATKPDMALVSMGIYVFRTEVLLSAADRCSTNGECDFGKDVIPELIRSRQVHAYNFTSSGSAFGTYWRDIGAIDTYYDSQMELLLGSPFDSYSNDAWPIHTAGKHPQFYKTRQDGFVTDSIVADDCRSEGARVIRSIVGPNTCLEPGAKIQDSVIMAGARVGRSARLRRVVVQAGADIPDHARIGFDLCEDYQRYLVTEGGTVVAGSRACPEDFGRHEAVVA